MKLFDVHTALGHWPFRRIPNQAADELRRLLNAAGITGAAAVNTHGLFYKNCHDANIELAEWIAPHRDFFVGIATLNPMYAAWERDLLVCRDRLGFRALRLAPQYHGYKLSHGNAVAIVKAATELGLPIVIPQKVVDVRQRHWMDTEQIIAAEEVAKLLDAVPGAQVVLTEAGDIGPLVPDRYAGVYFESSRIGPARQPAAIAARTVFGTGAPFKGLNLALLGLNDPRLSEELRRRVAWENAEALLGPLPTETMTDPLPSPVRP